MQQCRNINHRNGKDVYKRQYIVRIDLQTKEYALEMLNEIDEDIFNDLNVLKIEYLRKKDASWGDEVYLYKITNVGNIPIKSILVDFVYYNRCV